MFNDAEGWIGNDWIVFGGMDAILKGSYYPEMRGGAERWNCRYWIFVSF
jgi:hypothetical protein